MGILTVEIAVSGAFCGYNMVQFINDPPSVNKIGQQKYIIFGRNYIFL